MTDATYILTRCCNHPEHFFIQRSRDGKPVGGRKEIWLEELGLAVDDLEQMNFSMVEFANELLRGMNKTEEEHEDRP